MQRVTLDTIGGGALVELFALEMSRVLENIADPNTETTAKRTITLQVDDEQGGKYVIRVGGTDRFGNPVVNGKILTISGQKDETRLRLLADRQTYKVGEEASVNLHSRGRPGTALLTWEADRILSYKVVRLEDGANRVAWTIDGAQFPNFTLAAARMAATMLV